MLSSTSSWVRVRFSRIDANSDYESCEDATGLSRWRFTIAATTNCKRLARCHRLAPWRFTCLLAWPQGYSAISRERETSTGQARGILGVFTQSRACEVFPLFKLSLLKARKPDAHLVQLVVLIP